MKALGIIIASLIGIVILLAVLGSLAPDPMADPTFRAQVNQRLLENCLRADRERITLYGEAKPSQECVDRELAYAMREVLGK